MKKRLHIICHSTCFRWIIACVVVAMLVIGGAYLYFYTRFDLVFRYIDCQLPPGYENLDGKKIVLFSDLHMLESSVDLSRLRRCVTMINNENADFVFLLGDYIASENFEGDLSPARIITRLSNINAKNGVYAITGNHDWLKGTGNVIMRQFEQVGITMLNNNSVTVPGICNIAGVQDLEGNRGPQVGTTLNNLDPTLPTLALIHRPEYWKMFPSDIRLFFAGHTHGGQINLPFIHELMLKHIGEEEYDSHEKELGNLRKLFITYGIGTSWIRIRVNCPAEILVLTCKK